MLQTLLTWGSGLHSGESPAQDDFSWACGRVLEECVLSDKGNASWARIDRMVV